MRAGAPATNPFGPAPAGVRLRMALVRHGETDASVRGRCCGSLDPPLSEEGRRQMQRTRGLVQGLAASAVYASPRQRALESARILRLDAPIAIDDRLQEIDFGLLEGLTYQDVAERFASVWRLWMQQPANVVFPQGEPFDVFSDRVEEARAELIERHHGDAIVVVAHGGVNRLILARALGLELRGMFRLQQTCGAVSVVDFYDGTAVLQVLNATWRVATQC